MPVSYTHLDVYKRQVVDRVSEVLDVAQTDIEEPPSFGIDLDTSFILGMGKAKSKVVILLDIRKVLTDNGVIMEDGSPEPDPVS